MEKHLDPEVQKWVGGLDPTLFEDENLASYVKNCPFGYLGHCVREDWIDAMMCETYLPTIEKKYLATWLTSTDARHFGDELECVLEEGGRDAVKELIERKLPDVHNLGIIYSSPEHLGSLDSTRELYAKFKEQGLMM